MTEIVRMPFPDVMAIELPKEKLVTPFIGVSSKVVNTIRQASYKGVVDKDGNWLVDPGFKCEKLEVGKYRVTHTFGYTTTSLSVTLLRPPGTLHILENHPEWFVIETLIDKVPTDKEFAFTLTMVISPPPSL